MNTARRSPATIPLRSGADWRPAGRCWPGWLSWRRPCSSSPPPPCWTPPAGGPVGNIETILSRQYSAQAISRQYQGSGHPISRQCPGSVQPISRQYPGSGQPISRQYPGNGQPISRQYLGSVRPISRQYPGSGKPISGRYPGSVQPISRQYQGSGQPISKQYLDVLTKSRQYLWTIQIISIQFPRSICRQSPDIIQTISRRNFRQNAASW